MVCLSGQVLLRLQLAGERQAERGGNATARGEARSWQRGLEMACQSVSGKDLLLPSGGQQGLSLQEFQVLLRRVARIAPALGAHRHCFRFRSMIESSVDS